MSNGALVELFTKWGFEVDTSKLQSSFDKLEDLRGKLNSFFLTTATATVAAAAAIVKFTADSGASIDRLAKRIGTSTDSVQELEYAFQRLAGLNKEQSTDILQSFAVRIKEAAMGTGEAIEGLQVLGLGDKILDLSGKIRPIENILYDVADAMRNLNDPFTRVFASSKLFEGESEALTTALLQGRGAIERYRNEARSLGYVMSSSAIAQSVAFQGTMQRVSATLISLRNALAIKLMPIFEKLANRFIHFIQTNRAFINLNMDKIADDFATAFEFAYKVVDKLWSTFRGLVDTIGGVDKLFMIINAALVVLTTSMVALNTLLIKDLIVNLIKFGRWLETIGFFGAIVTAEFWLWVAVIAAIILILEDLYQWFTGGNSAIKMFVEKLGELWGEAWDGVVKKTDEFMDWFRKTWNKMVSFLSSFSFADVFSFISEHGIDIAQKAFRKFLDSLFESVKGFFADVAGLSLDKVYDVMIDKITATVTDMMGMEKQFMDTNVGQISAVSRLNSITPEASPAFLGGAGNQTVINQEFHSTYEFAPLPLDMSKRDAMTAVENQLKQSEALYNFGRNSSINNSQKVVR